MSYMHSDEIHTANIFTGATVGKYLPWLDCLRGLAAILVIFSHFVWTPYAAQQGIIHYLFSPGQFGVALFFCISGFIIPMSVAKEPTGRLAKFIIHRLFRLYPVYWIAILVTVALYGASLNSTLVNLTMVQRYLGWTDILPVAWTLQVEVAFYAVVAVLMTVPALKNGRGTLPVILIALGVICITQGAVRYFIQLKMPVGLSNGLFVMIFSWIVFFKPRVLQESGFGLKSALLLLVAVEVSWFWSFAQEWGGGEVAFWSAFGQITSYSSAIIIFAWASRRRSLRSSALIWCGQISYSLYLFHEPVRHLGELYVDPYAGALCGIVLSTIATFAISHIAFKLVEKPMVRLGRRAAGLAVASLHPKPIDCVVENEAR